MGGSHGRALVIEGLVALALAATTPADAGAVLRSLEEAGRALHTLQASFTETKVLVLLDEKAESRGAVFLQVPGRFRWNYETPQESVVLVKDGRFARYFPKSKQVFRGEAKGEADLLVGFGPGAAGLGKKYEATLVGEESVGEVRTNVLDLKPRAGQAGLFSAIRIYVDKARFIPVQTRLTEPTGDSTTVRFEKMRINEKLPAGVFELSLPKGVVEVR
ncbi:MAG TPA: outer membrane lipoprotein carrier protein LolA [Vicinamibacteria bacterium]|nr:outer membrane lipoprotein carrier protein LolA [Vicinamibacteria bacterium]